MYNNIKRIFSCISVLAICFLGNTGLMAKATTNPNLVNIVNSNSGYKKQDNNFVLYSGMELINNNENVRHHLRVSIFL